MDVAVIGGGIVGTATAAFLAEAGARVRLYEREALAAGASGRNSGVIQQPFDDVVVPLYEETVGIYRRLQAETGARIADLDAPGGLLLVTRHEPFVFALAARLGERYPHLRPTPLSADDLRREERAMADGVAGCRFEMGHPIVPSAPTYAFAGWADRLGVTIRLGRAAAPAVAGDRCTGVEVGGRVEPADAVVIAAGPWTPALADPSGRWRPIEPRWGVVVETLLANPPRLPMEEAELDEALGTGEVGEVARGEPASDGTAAGPGMGFSLITAAGASAVGSTFLADEPHPPDWTERLLGRGATFVPGIADAPIREVRACARPVSADGRALVGAVPWTRNLFVAAGHGAWGISTGPASARQVADLVLGRDPDIDPAFSPARFGLVAA
ncbi:MAG TPA: FAD-binding oxidoreductase [Candidatus Limnocylindrales bacterium]|nr:FAD-binding oxidoreductase [Candidatus Limnocylindrales bacterium]